MRVVRRKTPHKKMNSKHNVLKNPSSLETTLRVPLLARHFSQLPKINQIFQKSIPSKIKSLVPPTESQKRDHPHSLLFPFRFIETILFDFVLCCCDYFIALIEVSYIQHNIWCPNSLLNAKCITCCQGYRVRTLHYTQAMVYSMSATVMI